MWMLLPALLACVRCRIHHTWRRSPSFQVPSQSASPTSCMVVHRTAGVGRRGCSCEEVEPNNTLAAATAWPSTSPQPYPHIPVSQLRPPTPPPHLPIPQEIDRSIGGDEGKPR